MEYMDKTNSMPHEVSVKVAIFTTINSTLIDCDASFSIKTYEAFSIIELNKLAL